MHQVGYHLWQFAVCVGDEQIQFNRFLAIRRGLGYKFDHQAHRLAGFIAFMEARDANVVTIKLALEWATQPPERHASWALRLADERGFARHLVPTNNLIR